MKYDWSKERLESTVKLANCWFNWLEILGIPKRGSNWITLKNKAINYGIDTSHFNYVYAKTHNGFRSVANQSEEEFFAPNNPHHRNILKREYVKRVLGGKSVCEICGTENWLGKPLVLQIHHKDGNCHNNSIDNLQLLCPNCHTQTDTFCSKKRNK